MHSKFSGMDVPDAMRLKSLKALNTRQKKLLAETLWEIEGLHDTLRNTGSSTAPSAARAVDVNEGAVAAELLAGGAHQWELGALRPSIRQQLTPVREDRGPCP